MNWMIQKLTKVLTYNKSFIIRYIFEYSFKIFRSTFICWIESVIPRLFLSPAFLGLRLADVHQVCDR